MKIFCTGASGYIGGSVAAHLAAAGHQVTGLVRSAEKADAISAFGIEPVMGTLDDAEILSRAARAADVVVNAASADHRGAVTALLDALAGSGKAFVHTSGSSIVGTRSRGERSDDIFARIPRSRHHPRVSPASSSTISSSAPTTGAAARSSSARASSTASAMEQGATVCRCRS